MTLYTGTATWTMKPTATSQARRRCCPSTTKSRRRRALGARASLRASVPVCPLAVNARVRLDGGGTFDAVSEEQRKAVEERIAAASSGKTLEDLTFDKMQQIRSFYTQVPLLTHLSSLIRNVLTPPYALTRPVPSRTKWLPLRSLPRKNWSSANAAPSQKSWKPPPPPPPPPPLQTTAHAAPNLPLNPLPYTCESLLRACASRVT